ncbi:MAG: glycoside hydrolase family 97 protein [Planctomycetaceae bacterium]|nr:glycoside hydrolase family 97 protein [Planctomycetaceae bacterium]MCB9951928.1 glycoside hydrolase family 97 protein [Planctomycetaceae bacterium]
MSIRHFLLLLCLVLVSVGGVATAEDATSHRVTSSNQQLVLTFRLGDSGEPQFDVTFRGRRQVSGACGLQFKDSPPLRDSLKVVRADQIKHDETYAVPVGKTSESRDEHHELAILLEETKGDRRQIRLLFRAFNDGIAFRYDIPEQPTLSDFVLTEELTQLTFQDSPEAHYLPLNSYTTPYEVYYKSAAVGDIPHDTLIGLPTLFEYPAANEEQAWLAVTEASLHDWAGMYLRPVEGRSGTFSASLSPLPGRDDGARVIGHAPHASPWRILMIADNPGRLLESNIVFNLNEPCAIADTSWIQPGKTTFPWWNGYVLEGVDFEAGLNTATHKHYIDFCAKHGIEYHSLDGTDTAWYGGPIIPNGPTDITTALPEIDLPFLLAHAKKKGVRLRLWMHWKALQAQMDEALPLYEKWGIEGIMVDFMDRDDQEMVAFYHEVAEKAAKHHLTVTWHGAYKPTGMERTWPNVMNYEAALNQEYNKWSEVGTPPEHNLNVAFIRALAGPVDYHQGGMRYVLPEDFKPRNLAPMVQGRPGHQMAMYIIYQNHLPMLVDYPAAYKKWWYHPDRISDIPTSWDETRVLHAEFGKCLVMARRKGDVWYLAGMTSTEPRKLEIPLDFCTSEILYRNECADLPEIPVDSMRFEGGGHYRNLPLRLELPAGGGFVTRLKPYMEPEQ